MEVNDFLEGSNYRSLNNSRKRLKEKLVAYKGGKCEVCGYDKCITALEFHHLDPTEKEFGIGGKNVLSFEKCKKEVDKCILVCANCHRMIHSGDIQITVGNDGQVSVLTGKTLNGNPVPSLNKEGQETIGDECNRVE